MVTTKRDYEVLTMRSQERLGQIRKLALTSALIGCVFTSGHALAQQPSQNDSARDGVRVGEMSVLRRLAPTGSMEKQASQQYTQMRQEAAEKNALYPDNEPQVQRLRAIARKLIPPATRWNQRAAEWKWEVNLFESKQVNAFCMPGGKIAFFSGILKDLKLTDDEVAIIMGHEMAHALREHGAERQGKAMVAGVGIRLAEIFASYKGYDPSMVGSVLGGAANLGMLKFSREDETEADLVGLDLAARAGFDPRAGVVVWQKMGMLNRSAPPQWLSSHPAGRNRIAEIERHLPEVMPLYARAKKTSLSSLGPYQTNVQAINPVQ